MKSDKETMLVCWDLSELLVIVLPGTLSKVLILPLPSLLAVQWMLQNVESFHHGQKATPEQISGLGKLDLSLFESFARLMDLPGWLRVSLGRRQFEPEFKTFMLQIVYNMMVLAMDLVEEAAGAFTCELTFKDLFIVTAVHRNAQTGTANYRWPVKEHVEPVGHGDDSLALAVS